MGSDWWLRKKKKKKKKKSEDNDEDWLADSEISTNGEEKKVCAWVIGNEEWVRRVKK